LVVVPDLLYGDYADLRNPQFDRDAWLKAHGKVCKQFNAYDCSCLFISYI